MVFLLILPPLAWMLAGILAEIQAKRIGIPERQGWKSLFLGGVWACRVLIWSTKDPSQNVKSQKSTEKEPSGGDDQYSKNEPPASLEEGEQSALVVGDDLELEWQEPEGEKEIFIPDESLMPESLTENREESEEAKSAHPASEAVFEKEGKTASSQGYDHQPLVEVSPDLFENVPSKDQEGDTIMLDTKVELEPFDALPKKPKLGKVKTVCPLCQSKTSHDKQGICQKCHTANTWLRQRWGIAEEGEEITWSDTDPYQEQRSELERKQRETEVWESEQKQKITDQTATKPLEGAGENAFSIHSEEGKILEMISCPHCGHRAPLDIYDHCVFCNKPVSSIYSGVGS
jgi:hypothetical protein